MSQSEPFRQQGADPSAGGAAPPSNPQAGYPWAVPGGPVQPAAQYPHVQQGGYPQQYPQAYPQAQPQPGTWPQPQAAPFTPTQQPVPQAAYPAGYPQPGQVAGYPGYGAPQTTYPPTVPTNSPTAAPSPYPQSAPAENPSPVRPTPLRPVPVSRPQQPERPAPSTAPSPIPIGPLPAAGSSHPQTPPAPTTASASGVQAPIAAPVAAANRPVPLSAANRPVPVTKAAASGPIPKLDNRPEEDGDAVVTEKAVRAMPPWLVSTLVHMVLLIILAVIGFAPELKNQINIEATYAETLGEQTLDDTLQSADSLNIEVEVPTLSFGPVSVDDPFAAPPEMALIDLDATKASAEAIDAPAIGLALSGREAGQKKALLAAYGGNATTEEAVKTGLEWLKRNQLKDGSWSLTGPYSEGGGIEHKVSATAMALLAFQGAGHTHKSGDFQREVSRGWDYLLKLQTPDGFFETESAAHHRLYAQAQATIALCEIFGMTKDDKFRLPAQKAIDFVHKAQAPEGGWRYEPKIDSDTSVTGWYVMALQSAMMAGIEVQSPSLDKINQFLDKVALEDGSRYCYKPGMEATLTMTAEGLLCRQYLGWKHSDPRLKAGIDYLNANPINYNDQNVYYWYYATQAAHHMDGDEWNQWNAVMRQAIPTAQTKTGAERGSWSPSGDRWGAHGGRLYVTCLSIYMLEVYYRHLPIYKYRVQ